MKRRLRVKVSRRRGAASPDAVAKALTDYLLGRTDTPPTICIPNTPRRAS